MVMPATPASTSPPKSSRMRAWICPREDWTYDDLRDAAARLTRDTDDDGKSDSWGIWFGAWYQANLTLISRP